MAIVSCDDECLVVNGGFNRQEGLALAVVGFRGKVETKCSRLSLSTTTASVPASDVLKLLGLVCLIRLHTVLTMWFSFLEYRERTSD